MNTEFENLRRIKLRDMVILIIILAIFAIPFTKTLDWVSSYVVTNEGYEKKTEFISLSSIEKVENREGEYLGFLIFSQGSLDQNYNYIVTLESNTVNKIYRLPETTNVYIIEGEEEYIEVDWIIGKGKNESLKGLSDINGEIENVNIHVTKDTRDRLFNIGN